LATNNSLKGVHIVQYPREVSLCTGCGGCESVCSLIHHGKVGHATARLFVDRDTIDMMHTVYTCRQCPEHPCYDACRSGAMQISDDDIVYIDENLCIGCRQCQKACPYEPKRINYFPEKKQAQKCDLCRGRAGGPACIADCQVSCLGLSNEPVPVPLLPELPVIE
jgi:Fe-S-cluster-containing hydrogenase component 2